MIIPKIYSDTDAHYEVCNTEKCLNSSVLLKSCMNESVDPCEDFYEFACGMFETNYPSEINFYNWVEITRTKVNDIIKRFLNQDNEKDEPVVVHKTRMFYKSCLNFPKDSEVKYKEHLWEILINLGLHMDYLRDSAPLEIEKKIAKIYNYVFVYLFFNMDVNVKKLIPHARLVIKPIRSSVTENFNTSTETKNITDKKVIPNFLEYFKVIIDRLPNHNQTQLRKMFADNYMELKAQNFKERFENISQNAYHNNNIDEVITIGELQNFTDSTTNILKFNWTLYLSEIFRDINPEIYKLLTSKYSDEYEILIKNKQYIKDIIILLDETPTTILKMVILRDVIDFWEYYFSPSEVLNSDNCVSSTLKGFKLVTGYPIINIMDNSIKVELGEIVENIKWAVLKIINEISWMDDETRNSTIRKLEYMKALLGFPDNYIDILNNSFVDLNVTENYVENNISISIHNSKITAKYKFRLSTNYENNEDDIYLWTLMISIVNAFAAPMFNRFIIPVAILQPPFYYNGVQTLNYGAAGSIVGHEIMHHFDNIGIQYNEVGDMVQWWPNKSIEEYKRRSDCLVDYYNNITVISHNKVFKVNGSNTLSENIADIMGLKAAYLAYKHYVDVHGQVPRLPFLERYTQDQIFFLGYANHNCKYDKNDEEFSKADVHSPCEVRVRNVVSMLPEFAKAWSCPLGSLMNPTTPRCRIL